MARAISGASSGNGTGSRSEGWRDSGPARRRTVPAGPFTKSPACAISRVKWLRFRGPFFFVRNQEGDLVQVLVRDNNVDQALRALKKKMQREGVFREMKLRRNYEKPSERRAREKAEAVRRYRKLLRKRMEREGY
jgi:small subunit ribosomal protein S21